MVSRWATGPRVDSAKSDLKQIHHPMLLPELFP